MQAVMSEQYGAFAQFFPPASRGSESVGDSARDVQEAPFRVSIVEASVPLARLLAVGLAGACSSVEVSHDLDSGLKQFDKFKYDLLIVDLDLPGLDVQSFLRALRAKQPEVMVLALSAQSEIAEMVNALDNGADDYLSKPFSLLELMARVRALRRRLKTAALRPEPKSTQVVLHPDQCRVERDGHLIDLTPREFTLLEYLMQNPGKTLSRAVLAEEVWKMPMEGRTNIVDVYIKYLRDKLDGVHDIKLIRTVRGLGYSYQPQM
jgi:DNA-binding response OmpR family regulator